MKKKEEVKSKKPARSSLLGRGSALSEMPGAVKHPDLRGALNAAIYARNNKAFKKIEDLIVLESIDQLIDPDPFFEATAQSAMQQRSSEQEQTEVIQAKEPAHFVLEPEDQGIFIGNIMVNDSSKGKLCVSLKSLAQHVAALGTTGIGKSWLVLYITLQLQQKGKTVIVFDCENEYSKLLKSCDPENVWIFTPQKDRVNIFEPPPKVPVKEWVNKLLEIFREVFFLRDGAINLLRNLLIRLYEERGVFIGSLDFPTVKNLVDVLNKLSFRPGSRFAGYLESLVNRFTGLLYSLPETLNCKKGYDLTKEKEGKIIIYDTSTLNQEIANFYVYEKILREATYREKLPPEGLKVVIIIEEAHTLFNTSLSERYDLGEHYAIQAVRRHRKRGICYILCDQAPAHLPTSLSANISTKMILKTVDGKNIQWVRQCLGLHPDQTEYLRVLPERQMIFMSSDYPAPVLVEIPELSFDYVSPAEIEAHMKPILERLDYTPMDEQDAAEILQGVDMTMTSTSKSKKPEEQPGELWKQILELLADKKVATPDEIFSKFSNLKFCTCRKIKDAMEKHGMIEIVSLCSGYRGNLRKYMVITEKGAAFIGQDYNQIRLLGKGSLEHRSYQFLIAESMKQEGKTVEIEYSVNGKSADLVEIRSDGSLISLEIELQPAHPHVGTNVTKDLEAGFSKVIIIVQNKSAKNQAQNQVVQNVEWTKQSKVEYRLVKEFFPKTKKKEK